MDRWKDRVAVVTGASSGIGAAVAKKLVEHGMIVVGAARRVERLEELKQQLPQGRFHAVSCDFTNEQDIIKLFQTVDEKLQRVDVLVNNAGVGYQTSLLNPSNETLHALFSTNVIGPCLAAREALKIMKKRNIDMGYIMYTNSTDGHTVYPIAPGEIVYNYGYAATKFALKAIVEGLRQELRAQGSKIRVGEVSPGIAATEIWSKQQNNQEDEQAATESKADWQKQINSTTPLLPEDIADAFVYMLSAPERADVNEIIINHSVKQ